MSNASTPDMTQAPLPLVLCVEGNIGAGKSTVLTQLKELFKDNAGVVFVDEPVDDWVKHGFLERMYKEPASRPAFQHMVLQSLAGSMQSVLAQQPPPALIITERSPWSNYHTFGKANLSGEDWKLFAYTWSHVNDHFKHLDVRFVYLKADPQMVRKRMAARGREAEKGVSLDYLEKLDFLHDDWLEAEEPYVITIDANRDATAVFQTVCAELSKLSAEVEELNRLKLGAVSAVKEATQKRAALSVMVSAAESASEALSRGSPSPSSTKRQRAQ